MYVRRAIFTQCARDLNRTAYCNALEFEGHFVIVSRHGYKNSDLYQMILLYCIKINLKTLFSHEYYKNNKKNITIIFNKSHHQVSCIKFNLMMTPG